MRVVSSTTKVVVSRSGVLVLSGYGLRVAVERGHLTVTDGRGRERREGRFSRASRQLRRLIVLGHTGYITFEALRWLADVECSFVQLDGDGTIIAATGPAGLNDARLRRAQARSATNGAGLLIGRDLLTRKLMGQAAVLDRFGTPTASAAAAYVRSILPLLDTSDTPDALRWVEADAAAVYFGAWVGLSLEWSLKDVGNVPSHWTTFAARISPLTGTKRQAADPTNSLLNLSYSILESEARLACIAVGLDPGMGLIHADQRARDSLALDVMEPVRPVVDRWVLDQIAHRTFAARDFFETRAGVCRVMPRLAKLVAETAPAWAAAVAPVAEGVARALMNTIPGGERVPLPTHLTQANRSAGRDSLRRRRRTVASPAPPLPQACVGCGVILDVPGRSWCDECLPDRRAKIETDFRRRGAVALAALRREGRDPAHGGVAATKRGARNAAHVAAAEQWEQAHGGEGDDTDFARDILPGLHGLPTRALVAVTGLSHQYVCMIRRGAYIPHRRHWDALRTLAGEQVTLERPSSPVDRAHGGEAGARRGQRNAAHVAAIQEWTLEHGDESGDAEVFRRDILPGLQGVPLRVIATTTGLSESYCAYIRSGRKVPHRRHWVALGELETGK